MAKPNLHSLNKMDFLKVVPARKEKIAAAPARPVPSLSAYEANRIAAALHPARQYLKVTKVIERTPDVKSYLLAPDVSRGTEELAWFSAGQYLSVEIGVQGVSVTRPYSLSSSPREALAGEYMLTVKRTEGGLVSSFILENWKEGTEVTVSAPLGQFTYEPLRDAKQVIGIAGGSGITPFLSLAKAIADGDENFCLTLLYGSRSRKDALFQEEFADLAAKCGGKFRLVNVFSDVPEEGSEKGFITADLIRKYAPKGEEYSLFLCGPQAMYRFADKEIATLGLRNKFIRHELFGEVHQPEKDPAYSGKADAQFRLTVRICGEEKTVDCSAEDTLLVAMEKNGIHAPARCRSGECGWCHSRLVSGNVFVPAAVDGRRMADLQFGYIHPCCSFPLGDVTLDVPPFKN